MSSIPDDNLLHHLDALGRLLARVPFGLFTDIDGTLAELAPTPGAAMVRLGCRRALERLVGRLAVVAVVSGRPAAQAREMVGVPGVVYLGDHGLERLEAGAVLCPPGLERERARVQEVAAAVRRALAIPGMLVEEKGLVVAFHYRNAPWPEAARQQILRALQAHPEVDRLQVGEGKQVVELRPLTEWHKGTAAARLAEEFQLRGCLYLGDDLTDLDAFRCLREVGERGALRALAVAVAGPETPGPVLEAADYRLEGVEEVEQLLEWLAGRVNR